MDTKLFSSLLFVLSFSFSLSSSAAPPSSSSSSPASPATICSYTPYPSFCRSALPANNNSANVYDYGRFSVRKSLSTANRFLALINRYLGRSSMLTPTAVGALRDCQFLAQLNLDFLSTSFLTLSTRGNGLLPTLPADDVSTMLSAILTNTQTCLDGLDQTSASWSVKNGISSPLANDTRLYSVALALVNKAWVPIKMKPGPSKPRKKQLRFSRGRLPLTMSDRNRAIFERFGGRRLLQTSEDDVMIADMVVVSQDGSGNFTTINDAVNFAPNNLSSTDGYFLIYVTTGMYEEYVSIGKNKKYLMMIGDGINQTIITGNHNFVDGWTTFNSATFAVVGTGFVAMNMTFRNTAGAVKHQAVAVRNGADLSTFSSCSFEGYQDTLYAHSLRQFYSDCDIYGTIDFIFGNAAVVFQDCNIYSRLPMVGQFNTVTAQGRTDPNQNTGTSIQSCTIEAAPDLASSNTTVQTYLGRPWKLYSTTVFMESFMGSLINPAGWSIWSGDFALNTSFCGEYNNTGPGSNTADRVTWPAFHVLNATSAAKFNVSNFLLGDDWLPQTGVLYRDGL